jgi:hypothetical protein
MKIKTNEEHEKLQLLIRARELLGEVKRGHEPKP